MAAYERVLAIRELASIIASYVYDDPVQRKEDQLHLCRVNKAFNAAFTPELYETIESCQDPLVPDSLAMLRKTLQQRSDLGLLVRSARFELGNLSVALEVLQSTPNIQRLVLETDVDSTRFGPYTIPDMPLALPAASSLRHLEIQSGGITIDSTPGTYGSAYSMSRIWIASS